MGVPCRKHGMFLYPGGEVYVGQWIDVPALSREAGSSTTATAPAAVANSVAHARQRRAVSSLCTASASDSDEPCAAVATSSTSLFWEAPPCRDGWGVFLRGTEKYEGEWRNDAKHGLGCVNARGGERYVGHFEDDVYSGRGVSVSQSGVVQAELWNAGQLCERGPFLDGMSVESDDSSGSSLDTEAPHEMSSHPNSIGNVPTHHTVENGRGPFEESISCGIDTEKEHVRSNLREMNSWTIGEVARLLEGLGLDAPTVAVLRAHRVDGAVLGTLASRSSSPFLRSIFDSHGVGDGRSGAWRLFVIALAMFMKLRQKLSVPSVSTNALREGFRDLVLDESSIVFGDVVGQGGYGLVYKARWMNADVAAKAFRTNSDKNYVPSIFFSELKLLCLMRHPNITLLLGFCLRPQCIIITEYVSHGSLFDVLHKKRRHNSDWNFSRSVSVALEICFGMVYLHSHDVLHCDLKSSNVLLGESFEVKICDFGLAHLLDESCCEGQLGMNIGCVGTHNWTAPEVLRGEEYSKSADVYSLAMILWEMVSRQVPLHGLSVLQVIGIVGYGRQQLRLPRGCPEPLGLVLQGAQRRTPRARPSFQELSDELSRLHHRVLVDVEDSLWEFMAG